MTNFYSATPDPSGVATADAVRKIIFLSRQEAEELLAPAGAVIIAIHDASEPPADLREGWADRLDLKFHDTEDDTGVQTPYSRDQAAAVLELVCRHRATAPIVYVHCHAGQSRSAGIALALAELLGVKCFQDADEVTLDGYGFFNSHVWRKTMQVAHSERYSDFF